MYLREWPHRLARPGTSRLGGPAASAIAAVFCQVLAVRGELVVAVLSNDRELHGEMMLQLVRPDTYVLL